MQPEPCCATREEDTGHDGPLRSAPARSGVATRKRSGSSTPDSRRIHRNPAAKSPHTTASTACPTTVPYGST